MKTREMKTKTRPWLTPRGLWMTCGALPQRAGAGSKLNHHELRRCAGVSGCGCGGGTKSKKPDIEGCRAWWSRHDGVARRAEEIYAESPVVSQGLGEGWVGGRSPGWVGANAITAPVAIACKTDDNDLLLSSTYSPETAAVAGWLAVALTFSSPDFRAGWVGSSASKAAMGTEAGLRWSA